MTTSGHVVARFGAAAEGEDVLEDLVPDLRGRQAAELLDLFRQALDPVLVVLALPALDDPVGVKAEDVAGAEGDGLLGEGLGREHPQAGPGALEETGRPLAPQEERRVVAGVDEGDLVPGPVEDGQEERDEEVAVRARVDEIVELGGQLAEIDGARGTSRGGPRAARP